jgi:hypothetical protein
MVNAPIAEETVQPIDKIGWVMHSILYAVEQTFDGHGIELPSLRYLTYNSTPAHDCEQVTVSFLQGYLGPPGDQSEGPQQCNGPRSGVFHVEVVRCVPQAVQGYLGRGKASGSTAPDVGKMYEYSMNRGKDLWALLDSTGMLSDYNGAIADVSISDPQGEYQAAVLNLVVQL